MENGKMKIWEASALVALCLALCAGSLFSRDVQRLEKSVIRLHVVAVSDEESEQALKLRVRDAVLDALRPALEDCSSAGEAGLCILSGKEEIIRAAESAAEGRTVSFSFSAESFGVTESGGVTLPAGTYSTLRLTLGEGKGHNWWGVVFPELTPEPAVDASALCAGGVQLFSGGEGRVVRFRAAEVFESVIDRLRQ